MNKKPYYQGYLDSLCGIYAIVNADYMVNGTTEEESKKLFGKIMTFLQKENRLADIFSKGMLLKDLTNIMEGATDLKLGQKLKWQSCQTPDLDTFWKSMTDFMNQPGERAIILGLSGVHDHWTVIKKITPKQICLHDSDFLKRLRRENCTTAYSQGDRKHVLWPAQTYFLSKEACC